MSIEITWPEPLSHGCLNAQWCCSTQWVQASDGFTSASCDRHRCWSQVMWSSFPELVGWWRNLRVKGNSMMAALPVFTWRMSSGGGMLGFDAQWVLVGCVSIRLSRAYGSCRDLLRCDILLLASSITAHQVTATYNYTKQQSTSTTYQTTAILRGLQTYLTNWFSCVPNDYYRS